MDSATAASAAVAVADGSGRPRLHSDSLPVIDLRLLSQSELYSLSLSTSSSASSAHDDGVLIPKIDRSVFNESAGSRKQTFSRLRLAPRGTAASSSSSSASSSSSLSRQKKAPPPQEPLDEDNSRIIALLQHLFAKEDGDAPSIDPAAEAGPLIAAAGGPGDADLIQVRIEYDKCLADCSQTVVQSVPIEVVDLGPMKRKRGRPRKCEKILDGSNDAVAFCENDGEEDAGMATETNSNEDSIQLEDSMKAA